MSDSLGLGRAEPAYIANRGRLTPAARPPLSALVAVEDMIRVVKSAGTDPQMTLPVTNVRLSATTVGRRA
jgi:hypothetical protein